MSIDYGHGRTNVDLETGIRYGVISQHMIGQIWADDSEPDYGEATCPQCGDAARDVSDVGGAFAEFEQFQNSGFADYGCAACGITFDSSEAFSDMPQGYSYREDGYAMTSCLDTDVMVLKSPFFTYAPFCSPCVPGAGNLDDAARTEIKNKNFTSPEYETMLREFAEEHGFTMGVKTYAVGHDWFDPPVAPYRVFSVLTGREVFPDSWYCKPWDYNRFDQSYYTGL